MFKAGDKIRQLEDCSGAIKGEIYELIFGDRNRAHQALDILKITENDKKEKKEK